MLHLVERLHLGRRAVGKDDVAEIPLRPLDVLRSGDQIVSSHRGQVVTLFEIPVLKIKARSVEG